MRFSTSLLATCFFLLMQGCSPQSKLPSTAISNVIATETKTQTILTATRTITSTPAFSPTPEILPTPTPTPHPEVTPFIPSIKPVGHINLAEISQVVWSSNGTTLAAATSNGLYLYDANTLQQLRHLGSGEAFYSVDFSPDNTVIATASKTGVQLWDTLTGKLVLGLGKNQGPMYLVKFSPDGKRLASTGGFSRDGVIEDETIFLWDVSSARLLQSLQGHYTWVVALSFNPDGSLLASGGNDGMATIWLTSTGQREGFGIGDGYWWRASSITFSANGQTLIVALGNRIEVWDWKGRTRLARFAGFEDVNRIDHAIFDISLSPDERLLALAREESGIQLWDFPTTKLVYTSKSKVSKARFVAFKPKGLILAIGNQETIELWKIQEGEE